MGEKHMRFKKWSMVFMMFCLLLFAVNAEGDSTPFDRWRESSMRPDRVYYITDLPLALPKLTPGEIAAFDQNVAVLVGNAWYNLLDYELKNDVQSQFKTVLDKMYSAEIYDAMKEGPGIIAFTAKNNDMPYVNILIAKNNPYYGDLYWIECNLTEQNMKVMHNSGVEHYSSDDEFLSDYTFNTFVSVTIDNLFEDYVPKDAILKAYGSTNFGETADQVYAFMNNGKQMSEQVFVSKDTPEARLQAFSTVGNVVKFGRYEQDNDLLNGPEEIEWVVLDVQGSKALLFSKYGLDAKPFYEGDLANKTITWETSALRKWLNGDFLNLAFTKEEKAAILSTKVNNNASQGYKEWGGNGGKNTQDHIFIFSYAEANKYLGANTVGEKIKAQIAPTPYAVEQGADIKYTAQTEEGKNAARWWTRSPGDLNKMFKNRIAYIDDHGNLAAAPVNFEGIIDCPALWINLKSKYFK